jgi:hypothetical protein
LYEAFKLKLKLPLAYEHFLGQYMVPPLIRSRNFPTIALLVDGGDPIRPTYAMSGIPRILERRGGDGGHVAGTMRLTLHDADLVVEFESACDPWDS